MKIVAGGASPLLASRLATLLKTELAKTTYREFPDGELYVKIEGIEEEDVIVVQSINTNNDLVQLLLIFDALTNRAESIVAVIPYMGYARQDKLFSEGEAISIRAVARLIESYVDKVVTVNIHSKEAMGYFKKLIHLDAMPLLGKFYEGRSITMISPDLGSLERVRVAAAHAKCRFDYLEKTRLDEETVVIKPKELGVKNEDVVIVDDIISTGKTIAEAAKLVLEAGARSVECACVHAVLAKQALNRLYSAGVRRVVATDTVEKPISEISVAELIASALKS